MKSLTEIIDYKSGAQKSFKYIAIDLDTLKGLDDYEKAEVIDYIESKYNVEIKDASYTDLIANGIVAKFH